MTLKLTNLFGGGSLPIGAPVVQQDIGPVDTWGDGSVWLRSGTYSPISQYPLAAQLKKFQVYGGVLGGGTPVPFAPSGSAPAANPAATDGNQTVAYVPSGAANTTLLVTTNGGSTWAAVNVGNLGILADVVYWAAKGIWVALSYTLAAPNSTFYIYTATTPTGPWVQACSVTGGADVWFNYLIACGATLVVTGVGGTANGNYCMQMFNCTAANAAAWTGATPLSGLGNGVQFGQRPIWLGSSLLFSWFSNPGNSNYVTTNFTAISAVAAAPSVNMANGILGYAFGYVWAVGTSGLYKAQPGVWSWTAVPGPFNTSVYPGAGVPTGLFFDGTHLALFCTQGGYAGSGTQFSGQMLLSTDGVNFTPYPVAIGCSSGFFLLSSGLLCIPSTPVAGGTCPSQAYLAPQWPNPDSVGTTLSLYSGSMTNYVPAITYYRVA